MSKKRECNFCREIYDSNRLFFRGTLKRGDITMTYEMSGEHGADADACYKCLKILINGKEPKRRPNED